MTMVGEPTEEMMAIAQALSGGTSTKTSMKVIYAKRPMKDGNTGKPISMPGWVTWTDDDTRTGELWRKTALGWRFFKQLGYLGQRDGSPDPLGPWQKILEHKDGPALFPVDQLIEFGWYDPSRVPVEGVRFPQLKGLKIPLYPCPECNDRDFVKPIHLARHCRNAHSYDRKDIQDLADQLGIDLVREMYAGKEKMRTFDYTEDEVEPEPEVPAEYEVEKVALRPRVDSRGERDSQPVAKSPRKFHWTPERRAEASRKAKERMAANA